MNRTHKNDWQARREALIRALCQDIQGALSRGDSLLNAVRSVRRRYRGRSLGGGRKLRISKSTIYRRWYEFQAKPEAFKCRIRYSSKPKQLHEYATFLAAYFVACEGMSAAQAYRLLATIDREIPFGYRTLVRCLRPGLIDQIAVWQQRSMDEPAAWWSRNAASISKVFRKLTPRAPKEIPHDG